MARTATGTIRISPLFLLLLAVLAAPATADAKNVTVMTRNLYLGADLTPAIQAANPPDLAVAASGIWAVVQATDFPSRAKVLAARSSRPARI